MDGERERWRRETLVEWEGGRDMWWMERVGKLKEISKERKTQAKGQTASYWTVEKEEKLSDAEGGRGAVNQREKSEVHRGTNEWRKQAEGGKEVYTREPGSKRKRYGQMNRGREERRNNENSRQGCWPQVPLDRSEVSATQPGRMSEEGKENKTTELREEGCEVRERQEGEGGQRREEEKTLWQMKKEKLR